MIYLCPNCCSSISVEDEAQVLATTDLSAQLHNLLKFTNYSVSIAAYTRVGEGVRSPDVYIRTEQDGEFIEFMVYLLTILKSFLIDEGRV